MRVVVSVDMDDVRAYWRGGPSRIDMAIKRSMTQVGHELRREIVGKAGLSKYGRHRAWRTTANGNMVWNYPNPATGQPWSPAGDAPTQVSGKLRTTVTADATVRVGFGNYTKNVGPTMVYARVQDEGNPSNRNPMTGRNNPIPARPYMGPAMLRVESGDKIERIFLAEFAKALP